ncbi:MAG: S9 family peptidase [Anaerolineales bacterium]|nr:S9 family peptidase [Anaerolineales bacterium]
MTYKKPLPFGSWPSPLRADDVAQWGVGSSSTLQAIRIDGESVYWIEPRPHERGRSVIMKRDGEGIISTRTPNAFSVRSRVHEYGGGAYAVRDDVVFFVNADDQRIYRQSPSAPPSPITPAFKREEHRYGDLELTPDGCFLLAVRERHLPAGIMNDLIAISTDGDSRILILDDSREFYSSPRISPDGGRLAWLTWEHPCMPWDTSTLRLGEFKRGTLTAQQVVFSVPGCSVLQPSWSPGGNLYALTDLSGWWNLYAFSDHSADPVCAMEAEIGSIPWVFGLSDYVLIDDEEIAWIVHEDGGERLEIFRLGDRAPRRIASDWTSFFPACLQVDAHRRLWFMGSSFTQPQQILCHDIREDDSAVIVPAPSPPLPKEAISIPAAFHFPGSGEIQGHMFFYPPSSLLYQGLDGELPPLIVYAHSGPTSSANSFLQYEIQFWCSHGFAVADVNYRGSAGFGRAYREALHGAWGTADVEDCISAASNLVSTGRVDPARMIIRGRSAGGYTALRVLLTSAFFSAGASYFGITDLEHLRSLGGKFEAHYLDQLIGEYPAEAARYRALSPLHQAKEMKAPVILFQGSNDPVVPPKQAEKMAHVLESHGRPYRYIALANEGHGLRLAENIRRALEAELAFYQDVLGIR